MLCVGMRRASCSSAPQIAICRLGQPLRRTTKSKLRAPVRPRRYSSGQQQVPPEQPPPRKPSTVQNSESLGLLGRYTELLASRPLATKAITSGIIAGTGDLTSQVLATHFATEYFPAENDGLGEDDEEEEGELGSQIPAAWAVAADIDWGRCARFTLLGAGFLAPCLHFWYGFLGRAIPGKALSNVVKRVALDQLVFAPVFLMSFLSLVMLLDGQAAKIVPKLKADYAQTLVGNWGYWIPAQVINFRFVPVMYQVLCSNGFGFVWTVYLSYQSNKAVKAVEDGKTKPSAQPKSHEA